MVGTGHAPGCFVTARNRKARSRPAAAGAVILCLALFAPAFAHLATDRQIAGLTERIARSPDDAVLYLRRGELHRARTEWEAAARDYRRARKIDPALDSVDLCFGRMLLEAGRPARAIESIDRFLAGRAGHAGALAVRARALLRLERNVDAARDFTRAIEETRPPRSPDPDLYLERARALAATGAPRLREAIRGLDQGMAALGPLVSLGLYAVELEVRLGRFEAALARLDRLASQSPRKESWLVRRGDILEAAGRHEEANQAYEQALAAIAHLPPERRSARAVQNLEARARSRLASPAPPAGRRTDAPPGGAR